MQLPEPLQRIFELLGELTYYLILIAARKGWTQMPSQSEAAQTAYSWYGLVISLFAVFLTALLIAATVWIVNLVRRHHR